MRGCGLGRRGGYGLRGKMSWAGLRLVEAGVGCEGSRCRANMQHTGEGFHLWKDVPPPAAVWTVAQEAWRPLGGCQGRGRDGSCQVRGLPRVGLPSWAGVPGTGQWQSVSGGGRGMQTPRILPALPGPLPALCSSPLLLQASPQGSGVSCGHWPLIHVGTDLAASSGHEGSISFGF